MPRSKWQVIYWPRADDDGVFAEALWTSNYFRSRRAAQEELNRIKDLLRLNGHLEQYERQGEFTLEHD